MREGKGRGEGAQSAHALNRNLPMLDALHTSSPDPLEIEGRSLQDYFCPGDWAIVLCSLVPRPFGEGGNGLVYRSTVCVCVNFVCMLISKSFWSATCSSGNTFGYNLMNAQTVHTRPFIPSYDSCTCSGTVKLW